MSRTMHPRATAFAVLAERPHWHDIADRFPKWAAEVERLHGPGSLLQAAVQASHFSHDEVAVLAKELNSIPNQGRTAREICAEKLLLAVPAQLADVGRAQWLEGEKENALNRLNAIPAPGLGLQARPKSVKQMLRPGNSMMARLPGNGVVMISRTDLQGYEQAVQLHVDALIARSSGCRVTGLFAVASHGGIAEVKLSPQMLAEIDRVHDYYWQSHIAVNQLPNRAKDELQDLADRAAFLKLLGDAAYAEFKAIEPALRLHLADQRLRSASLQLRALTVEASEAGDLRFLIARSPQISSVREALRRDVAEMLDTRLSSVTSIRDVPETKLLPATEITRKPARKPASL
ncbi:hypothetical protein [Cupriavidus oxalaticus]|uniref:Uncharacterized protein n=1 Tax=Cupriavidus oxalaticus TaxID=96344 RepID=A0A4P7LII8_9BURK|nr:hypothetical protein [Cupriavidus oxalaticus]QBY55986.1 hypothetical protein E0W60_33555 [Cupriavidus oxalaticus]